MARVIEPVRGHVAMLEHASKSPMLNRAYIDRSWDEVAKYLVSSPESLKILAGLINRYPGRFLFGAGEAAPPNQQTHLGVFDKYAPLLRLLTKEASEKLRNGNYARLFDKGRRNVRAWERAHVNWAYRCVRLRFRYEYE